MATLKDIAASLLPVAGFAALLVVGYAAPTSILLVGLCSAIVNIGIGFMLVLVTVILSEAVDYGEFPARVGSCELFVTFSTVKDPSTGYPASVSVRTFRL